MTSQDAAPTEAQISAIVDDYVHEGRSDYVGDRRRCDTSRTFTNPANWPKLDDRSTKIVSLRRTRCEVATRPAWIIYTACLLSGGLFFFGWTILMMNDINYTEREMSPIKTYTIIMVALFISFWLFAAALYFSTGPVFGGGSFRWVLVMITVILGLTLNLFNLMLLARVSVYAARHLGYKYPVAQTVIIIVVLFLMAGLSFVLVQRRVNSLLERQRIAPEP